MRFKLLSIILLVYAVVAAEDTSDATPKPDQKSTITESSGNKSTEPDQETTTTESSRNKSTEPDQESTATESSGNKSTEADQERTTTESSGNKSTEPDQEKTTTESSGNKSTEPDQERTTTESSGNKSTEPDQEKTTTESSGNKSTEADQERTTTESSGNKSTEPGQESTTTESSGNKSTEPGQESTTTESSGNKSTEPDQESTSTESSEVTMTGAGSSSSSTSTTTTVKPPKGSEDYPAYVPGENGKPPCIFSNMSITLDVTYEKNDNSTGTSTLSVPEEAEVTGTCGDTQSDMTYSWAEGTVFKARNIRSFYNVYANGLNQITFHFKKDNSSIRVEQIDIDIVLDPTHFPDSKNTSLKRSETNLNLFSTSVEGKKYLCNTNTVVTLGSSDVQLSIKDVNLIAFNEKDDLTQLSEEYCPTEETTESANVGAIVGGVIAAVVVVGIIGFIIWRRKKNSYTHSDVA